MRIKDENKNEAIFNATISLLSEIGFSEISMSKIAKRAGVSPSTIYVYFENKEDMINKLYISVKKKMATHMIPGIEGITSVKEAFEILMTNLRDFVLNNKEEFLFLEQFSNSPWITKLCPVELEETFEPLFILVKTGQEQKILKDLDPKFLLMYCYFPIVQIAKDHFKGILIFDKEILEQAIQLSWDAIKA